MLSEMEKKTIKTRCEKVENLVKRYIREDDFNNEADRKSFVIRLRNTLLRNNCETIKDVYEHKGEFRNAASKTSVSFKIIERMKQDYENVDFKKKRLEEIDKEIRKLSEERKALLKELES